MQISNVIRPNRSFDSIRLRQLEGDPTNREQPPKKERKTDRNTIDHRKGGEKLINLSLATELGTQLPNANTHPVAFSKALQRGYEDIRRITQLFSKELILLRREI